MKGRHIGIFALVFIFLSVTVPSAFAQVSGDNPGIPNAAVNAQSVFELMDLITSGQTEAATLSQVIENNGLDVNLLNDYTDALDEAASLAAIGDYTSAEAALDDADALLDDVYNEIYAEVDSQQNARYDHFVDDAITSLTFLVENGESLGLSNVVINELKDALAIFLNGDAEEILAATGEDSNLGLVSSVFSGDVTSHPGFGKADDNPNEKATDPDGKGRGLGLGIEERLPPGIAERYGLNSNDDLGTQSTDGTGDENNGFFESFIENFGIASEKGNPDDAQGQGIGLGKIPWIFDYGFSPDDNASPPPFAEFDDTNFEPGKYGRDIAAEKIADAKLRAQEGRSNVPVDVPVDLPDVPGPPDDPGNPNN